jgi:predicted Ser/Thr protein kinase
MESTRWDRIQELFHAAADLPRPEQRGYLESVCPSDEGLVADVVALLDEDARTASPLDRGLAGVAEQVLGSAPLPRLADRTLGPYRLVRLLGEGGMGVVYLAERIDLGSLVAIKLLSDAGLSPARRERFASEQRTLARLDHPGIARLYDVGELDDGTPFIVMEYVEGVPLTEHCRERSAIVIERLRLFRSLCEAVQFAHRHAIIHRDIKPSNVLVKRDGSVRLLDFGIAKQLDGEDAAPNQTGLMTPEYAAPEQLRGEPVGVYTDVYALGVVLYELLAGRRPFERVRLESDELTPPSSVGASSASRAAWADLDVLVATALEADPHRRYRSVEALNRDIDNFLAGQPLEARPGRVGYRLRKFVTRNRRPVAVAAVALVALIAVSGFFVARLADERDRANRQAAIAASINRFLSDDLLGRSNPLQSGQSAETFVQAVLGAAPDVDRRFGDEPLIAARLHETIARALNARSDHESARGEYERAAVRYRESDGARSQDAIAVELERASMEARAQEKGSLDRARRILAEQEKLVAALSQPRADVLIELHSARGVVAYLGGDAAAAAEQFRAALVVADRTPSVGGEARLTLRHRLTFAYIGLGEGAKAEQVLRELIADTTRLRGADSPRVYLARQTLVHAFMVQRKFTEVREETDALHPIFVRMLGESHAQTLQLLASRAASELYLGRFADAIRDNLELHRLAEPRGATSLWSIASLADAGEAQCRNGQIADGEANTRTAHARAKTTFPEQAIVSLSAYSQAICLIAAGSLDEADGLLRDIDVATVSQMGDAVDYPSAIALARGEIALRRGDRPAAAAFVRDATPAIAAPGAIVYQKRKLAELNAALAE